MCPPRLAGSLMPPGMSRAAWRDVAPVAHGVVDCLSAGCAVEDGHLTVCTELSAGGVLFDVIPVAERVLVRELRGVLAVERDRPVRRVDSGQRDSSWI